VVQSALQHGETCTVVREKIEEALDEYGCERKTCDCEKLYVLVTLGIAVAATAIAVLSKNRIAVAEARDAIARAMRVDKTPARTIRELEKAERDLEVIDEDFAATQEHWETLLDRLKQAEENSFGTVGQVTIRKPPD
jgi:hypothetical protein